jgi:hypothetical protein
VPRRKPVPRRSPLHRSLGVSSFRSHVSAREVTDDLPAPRDEVWNGLEGRWVVQFLAGLSSKSPSEFGALHVCTQRLRTMSLRHFFAAVLTFCAHESVGGQR